MLEISRGDCFQSSDTNSCLLFHHSSSFCTRTEDSWRNVRAILDVVIYIELVSIQTVKHHYLLNKVKAKYTLLTENQDSIKAEVIKFRFKSVVKLGLSVGNRTKSANFLGMENRELC